MPSTDWGWDFFISLYKKVYRSHQNQRLTYDEGANGTAIEGDWDKVFECVRKCHENPGKRCSKDLYNI